MQPTQTVAIITSLLSLFVLLTACGGSNGTPADPDDVTAPTVTSTSPASGATKVLTSSSVTATFNEAMDSSTLTTSTFTLDEASPIAGSVSYDDSTLTATFASANSLKPGTLHTATLDTTVADSAGNSLDAVKVWSFTTENFIYRVSVDSSGIEANGDNNGVTISPDGRYVGFYSEATNLVANDTNGFSDTFVYDTQSGTISLVSVASDGTPADMASDDTPAISAGGQYVGFYSAASNLVSGDTNGVDDVFVRDTVNNTTTRVSVPNLADQGSLGTEADDNSLSGPSISEDGRYLAFASTATNLVIGDTNGRRDAFVHDMQSGATTRVSVPNLADQGSLGSEADNSSGNLTMSADGRYVAFSSTATNLVTGDTNALQDIFVHDTQTGITTRASVPNLADQGSLGAQATSGFSSWPSISSDSRYVLFESSATNLVIGDTNGRRDAFVHDMQTGATTRVSVPNLADQGFLGAEGDGSSATQKLSISSDGRYLAFASDSSNLVIGDTNAQRDIFVHDTQTGSTIRVNMDSAGTESDGDSHSAFISADGRYVAFISDATNLVAGDTNAVGDIFRALNTTP